MSRSHPVGGSRTAAPDELDRIRIATDQLELVGLVARTGQRITDMLLRGQDLAFLPAGAEPQPDAWISIAPGDVLFVVPPPLPSRPDWRPATATVRVAVRVGDVLIEGSAHLPPGTPTDRRLIERHPFLPLTSATIVREDRPAAEAVNVVIVNLARADEVAVR